MSSLASAVRDLAAAEPASGEGRVVGGGRSAVAATLAGWLFGRVVVRLLHHERFAVRVGLRLAGGPAQLALVLLALQPVPAVRGLVEFLGQPRKLRSHEVAGADLADRDAQRGDLPREVFG